MRVERLHGLQVCGSPRDRTFVIDGHLEVKHDIEQENGVENKVGRSWNRPADPDGIHTAGPGDVARQFSERELQWECHKSEPDGECDENTPGVEPST